ncbi:MAG: hypothetical protein ACJAVR_002923 [Paracoccaceae bacterium]|jgi:uncharacterized protein YcbX
MPTLSAIHRHPVKALGAESMPSIALTAGQTMQGDRIWALLHERSRLVAEDDGWARCTTFLRGAAIPTLMAVTCKGGPSGAGGGGAITFQHPDRPPLSVDPGTDNGARALLAWVDPLIPQDMPRPSGLYRAARGLTDTSKPTVSLMSDATLAAVSARMGLRLVRERFRGNLWVRDLPAWDEMNLAGRDIRIGQARLTVLEPIARCSATLANPETGRRDADVLQALQDGWGHTDFGMACLVRGGGDIALGDALKFD